MIDTLIMSFAVIYFLLTVLFALSPKMIYKLWGVGLLSKLIPQWNFFSPNPGTIDFYLLYREFTGENILSDWKELDFYKYERTYLTLFWNPNKIGKKSLFDLAAILGNQKIENEEDRLKIKLSIPYLLILNFISENSTQFTESIQFVVVSKNYTDIKPNVVFLSDTHLV